MAMKIKSISAKVEAHGPVPGKAMVYINTLVEFEGGPDAITFSVVVPNEGSEAEQLKQGNKKAKELAQRFIDFPN